MTASQANVRCAEMTDMVAIEQEAQPHRRRFSVDLGEVREFIALREMMYVRDDSPPKQEVDERSHSIATICL